MSRAMEGGELKVLVRELVKAFGGVEAAALELGVSAQRVSQWQRQNCPDQMPLLCICKLEAQLGRAIVTGAATRAAHDEAPNEVSKAVVASVGASAATLQAISHVDHDGRRDAAEIREVVHAAQENLHQAELLADAAGKLQPGPIVH